MIGSKRRNQNQIRGIRDFRTQIITCLVFKSPTSLPFLLPNSKNSSKAFHSTSLTEKSSALKTKMFSTGFTLSFAVTLLYLTYVNSTLLKVSVPTSPFFSPTLIRFQGLPTRKTPTFSLLTALLLIQTASPPTTRPAPLSSTQLISFSA